MGIKIAQVSKYYGSFKALSSIDLSIETGELVALLGPSGSGKTSLLRIIAGLETADAGGIYFDEENMTNTDTSLRKVGFVFQHYALFNHMTVANNISYGLRVRPRKIRPTKKEIDEKVQELLSLVKLEGLEDRFPTQLSGGQRQRVALARALAVQPKVLLLDEPFGALDAKVRKDLRRWLRKLHDEFQITSVFVTHDQEEALDVSDRIIVMNEGKVEQIGTPDEVYNHPNSPFVFDFLGNVNTFNGRIHKGILNADGFLLHTPEHYDKEHTDAIAYARPHHIELSHQKKSDGEKKAKVTHIHSVGPIVFVELIDLKNGELIDVELTKDKYDELHLVVGNDVYVKPKNVKVFLSEEFAI